MEDVNLIVQTAFVGDLILTIPLMKTLRRLDPKRPIYLLCRQNYGEFFKTHGLVDEVFEVRKKPSGNWAAIKKHLQSKKFHFVISPHQSFRSAYFVGQLTAKHKVGYQKLWNWPFFNHRLKRPMHWPEVLRQLVLLRNWDPQLDSLLKDAEKEQWINPAISAPIPDWAKLEFEDNSKKDPIIFLAPGSEWATKRWTIEGFIAVGNYFRDQGYQIVVTGAPSEKEIGDRVSSAIKGAKNVVGKTDLSQLYNLYRQGQLLICNDNGSMHMAGAAGLPVVSIFGPTVLNFGYRPWQDQARVVQIDLSCRPCGIHGGQKCPIGTHICMKNIEVSDVITKARELLLKHAGH